MYAGSNIVDAAPATWRALRDRVVPFKSGEAVTHNSAHITEEPPDPLAMPAVVQRVIWMVGSGTPRKCCIHWQPKLGPGPVPLPGFPVLQRTGITDVGSPGARLRSVTGAPGRCLKDGNAAEKPTLRPDKLEAFMYL
ncbi:uncharacterized protein LOC125947726 [Dermacentor silvarum]|uniref:uncharacterized protein LOC125947726 n=1 Tax=Dermacentor silvarum TaxID=543639 RepID=UPI002100E65D|nr:uncharacterized protein LOC125947726 [Dermacentor silvarum]